MSSVGEFFRKKQIGAGLILASLLLQVVFVRPILADELSELSERVCNFSERYAKELTNVQFDFSSEFADIKAHGQVAIHMGVLPFKYPKNGAFRSHSIQSGDEVVRAGNPQYSFRIVKPNGRPAYALEGLVKQNDRESIYKSWAPASGVYARCMAIDSIVAFSPIVLLNVSSEELFKDSRMQRKLISKDTERTVVDFTFPAEHPSKYTSVIASFGKTGEVVDFEVYQRNSEADLDAWHTCSLSYSKSEKTTSGFPLPHELQHSVLIVEKDKTTSNENVYRANNFKFETRDIKEFTLTHYGLPEPEGTTKFGNPTP